MQSALFSIRVALSGASDTTERLSLRWTPIPSAVLRLVTHAPIKWRGAAAAALVGAAAVLPYVSRPPPPPPAPPRPPLPSAPPGPPPAEPAPCQLPPALRA